MTEEWPKWHFRPIIQRSEKNADPGEEYFFKELGPLGALVRESIQNSLDAKINPETNTEPVRFCFSLNRNSGAMAYEKYSTYIEGLRPHLEAIEDTKQKLPDIKQSMDYLVVEDFGTHGLRGDTRTFSHEEGQSDIQDNDFYWFHRNVNRTSSRHKRGGSFGYGKQAFAYASKLNSFFTVSLTSSGKYRLFGNCVFKNHHLEGHRYAAYGDWGLLEKETEHDFAVIPNEEETFAQQMIRDFSLKRNQKPGLSVIVPFPDKNMGPEEITKSVIRNYFVPICRGQLVVEICENGNQCFELSEETILNIASNLQWEGKIPGTFSNTNKAQMIGLIKLVHWWVGKEETANVDLNPPSSSREPTWSLDLIPEAVLGQLRESLGNGDKIAIRAHIPISAKKRGQRNGNVSQFIILIHKDESYGGSDTVWIRKYLEVPRTSYRSLEGHVAAVIALEGDIEQLLRDSEEAAHIRHVDQNSKAHDNYVYAQGIIRFFRMSVQSIIRYLNDDNKQVDENWIDDWFSLPDESKGTNRKKKRKTKKTPKEEEDFVPSDPPPIDLEDPKLFHDINYVTGGFEISGCLDSQVEYSFPIKLGYSRDDGKDAFKKWKPFDFIVGEADITVESSGIDNLLLEGNLIRFSIQGPTENFSIRVTGFDTDRDLSINYRPRSLQNGGGEQ
jgi:hypothetical protein